MSELSDHPAALRATDLPVLLSVLTDQLASLHTAVVVQQQLLRHVRATVWPERVFLGPRRPGAVPRPASLQDAP